MRTIQEINQATLHVMYDAERCSNPYHFSNNRTTQETKLTRSLDYFHRLDKKWSLISFKKEQTNLSTLTINYIHSVFWFLHGLSNESVLIPLTNIFSASQFMGCSRHRAHLSTTYVTAPRNRLSRFVGAYSCGWQNPENINRVFINVS